MGSLLGVKNKKSEDYSKADFLEAINSHIKWKKHKTVNTYRYFLQFREVCPMQIIDWIQACWGRRNDRNVTRNQNKMADLPDPCAQALSSYILVTSFHNQQCDLVSSRNAPPYKVCGEKRCVTILKTAARETNNNVAESEEANPSSIEEVNFLGTSVCESMFIAIYTTQKIQLNMQETGAGSLYKLYCSSTLFWEINHDNRPIVLHRAKEINYDVSKPNFFAENNFGARISNKLKFSPFLLTSGEVIVGTWKPSYHRFPWYATFQIETPAETFPKFPSIIHVIPYMEVLRVLYVLHSLPCFWSMTW